eukprot:360633-Chlamydomonas_euryale.AAC.10
MLPFQRNTPPSCTSRRPQCASAAVQYAFSAVQYARMLHSPAAHGAPPPPRSMAPQATRRGSWTGPTRPPADTPRRPSRSAASCRYLSSSFGRACRTCARCVRVLWCGFPPVSERTHGCEHVCACLLPGQA